MLSEDTAVPPTTDTTNTPTNEKVKNESTTPKNESEKKKYAATTNSKTGLSKEEEEKLKENLEGGFTKKMNQKFCFIKEEGQTRTLTSTEVTSKDTLFFKGCQDSNFTVEAMCTKVCVENCKNCTFTFNEKIITEIEELWNNQNVHVINNTNVQTVQIDLSNGTEVLFEKTSNFNRIVWAATENLKIHFKEEEAAEHVIETGISEIKKVNPKINVKTDQFIVRLIKNKVTGKVSLRNELIIRLNNGYPTTEREEREFQRRQEANLQKLTKELLGKNINLGKKKEVGPKIKRNDPCKCGSKKKYKNCCGSDI